MLINNNLLLIETLLRGKNMKFSVVREEFLKYLQLISGAVERRQTLPILANVLISAHDKQVSLTATDLEVELVGRLSIDKIDDPGEITVAARKLIDICRNLPAESTITLSTQKDRLIVKSGKSRFSLATLPASDFPNIEEMHPKVAFQLSQRAAKELLVNTHFAMAQQDVRYYLNGMLVDINQGVMRVVATDGHRLSLGVSDKIEVQSDHIQIIVPRKGIMELMRLLEDIDEEVEVIIGTNHICVSTPFFTFTSKLVEGKFPDYQRVIPKNGNKIVIVDRELFKQALARVSILSNEKFRGVRLLISENLLKIVANNPDQEEAEDEIAVDYQGADLEIGFNVNYLLDVCNTIDADQVRLTFIDTNSSALMEAHDDKNNFVYVIMPMRI